VGCNNPEDRHDCEWIPDPLVCLRSSDDYDYDSSPTGICVPCSRLNTAIQSGDLKDEGSIRDLNATCDPVSSRGPNPAPQRITDEGRYLRWFLESSYVFEGKKVGDGCNASPALSKARAYVNILMRKHFGPRKEDANVSLATPGMEGAEEERLYNAVTEDLNDEKNKNFYKEKLKGIEEAKETLDWIYCSREEGLVCMKGNCAKCGDEDVKRYKELSEACNPGQEGGHRKK
jgi:hypothetical protein